ncbi:DUF1361 domain-containing protein [Peptostreptococcus faecalis]|uniref:DUF1361 domain-containing protein n=1 Tax=Peptostreptococcus faecalis TaxID=2045015 RepID=UPI001FA90A3C|nr:DUF1361 domain-containing protein [Peptostreptococcus faecalis]
MFVSLVTITFLLNIYSLITILVRPKIFGVKLFRPMIWNFKLSVLPLIVLLITIVITFLTRIMVAYGNLNFMYYVGNYIYFIGLLFWLLLLPNSGYLITELNLTHREMDEKEVPIWYDIVSILSFSLSGILNTILNIVAVQSLFLIIMYQRTIHKDYLFLSALVLMLLISTGIYMGREIRFNSWDVIHIKSFFSKLKNHFIIKGKIKNYLLFITFHSVFFMIIYMTFISLI